MPDIAKKAGAAVVGTGRSDFPNQINNVLAFPGIFRGALDCRASDINEEMKVAASFAIASLVSDEELNADYILPEAFDKRIGKTVAEAVKKAAIESAKRTTHAQLYETLPPRTAPKTLNNLFFKKEENNEKDSYFIGTDFNAVLHCFSVHRMR